MAVATDLHRTFPELFLKYNIIRNKCQTKKLRKTEAKILYLRQGCAKRDGNTPDKAKQLNLIFIGQLKINLEVIVAALKKLFHFFLGGNAGI